MAVATPSATEEPSDSESPARSPSADTGTRSAFPSSLGTSGAGAGSRNSRRSGCAPAATPSTTTFRLGRPETNAWTAVRSAAVMPEARSTTTRYGSASSWLKRCDSRDRLGGLGVARQEVRVVVLLHLRQPPDVRAAHAADGQPGHQQHEERGRAHQPATGAGPAPPTRGAGGRLGRGAWLTAHPVSMPAA
ncbi:hypothetical protein GCM10025868_42560 [Angustibacter aerolatus]|uniref:Uncharacterized protein n=1 Tax=Angustibacter aerolatus TaxID=1162965 RepID=A0ABQ6JL80_9ACTN|nr:hypothetical protein GCM10025868_42560 [Angustibacter aerolatus]